MRILEALAVALVCLTSDLLAGGFEEANELYDNGQFSEARGRYETLLKSGPWSANLFHNLGDTYFRLGEPGRAALQFERALVLDPAHAEAKANLMVARQQSGAKLWAPSWLDHAFLRMHTDFYVVLAVFAGWAAIALLIAAFVRRSGGGLAFLACGFALVAGYAAVGISHLERDAALAIVTARELPARLAPADGAGLVETLTAGSRVRILSERGEWIYCALPGDRRGWLAAGHLERVRIPRS